MANLKQIRQRIRTSKNIRQITRAMKLVAAARLKKAQDRVTEARPYSDKMRELMLSLSEAGDLPSHRCIEPQGMIAGKTDWWRWVSGQWVAGWGDTGRTADRSGR